MLSILLLIPFLGSFLLLLWPALWALWLSSGGRPDLVLVWIFVLGAALMRSAGCVVNDIADRNFDRHVARTRDRPITAGLVGVKEALVLAAVLTVLAGSLVLMLNWLTIAMSLLALVFAFTYPFTKRFFAVPQAYLGIAFGFGIPMAYAAATGSVPLVAWVMMLANVFWAIAYDTAYAGECRAGDAYQFEAEGLQYFVQDYVRISDDWLAVKYLRVLDAQSKEVVREKLFYSGESASFAPLDQQWTGILLKKRSPVIFGFQYESFGCPGIVFLSPAEADLYINCDNRH